MSAVYGLVIFISAYLLFQVQPLVSKSILPWFGGTPSVWTTCMLFFQILLFGGYAYAHLVSSKLSPKAQLGLHLVLMLLALTASVLPAASWKPTGAENPIVQIVLMLAVSIGLPFFVLSSTGPLVQNWFSRAQSGRSPYHLYALSNVGSLLGLLLYPFFIEIKFDLTEQGSLWWWGFVAFVVGCALCGLNFSTRATAQTVSETKDTTAERPTLRRRLLWFFLAAVPSIMLLATTNQVCLDVASIPFLWILPLTLYLLTFIISFAHERWYLRRTCAILLPLSLVGVVIIMISDAGASLELQLLGYFAALFFTAMCCHGELVRAKPAPQYLTEFYLWMSAGGAAGGLFVGLVAPYVFDLYLELHVGILAALVLMGVVWSQYEDVRWYQFWKTPGVIFFSIAISIAALLRLEIDRELKSAIYTTRNFYGVLRIRDTRENIGEAIEFFEGRVASDDGVLLPCISFPVPSGGEYMTEDTTGPQGLYTYTIYAIGDDGYFALAKTEGQDWSRLTSIPNPPGLTELEPGYEYITFGLNEPIEDVQFDVTWNVGSRRLMNGRILHGTQFLRADRKRWPTSYYARSSAIGRMMAGHQVGEPRHIGVVGLGTGSVAVYAEKQDRVTYYEINDDCVEIAGAGSKVYSSTYEELPTPDFDPVYFSYLKDFGGDGRIILGDARLALERADNEQFDFLVLDAFSSDAIPAHLLTVEAFEVYLRHMKDDGILAVHISNRHFDLGPVVAALANHFELIDRYVWDDPDELVFDDPNGNVGVSRSEWILMSKTETPFDCDQLRDEETLLRTEPVLWTDAYSNLTQVLKSKTAIGYKYDIDRLMESLGWQPIFRNDYKLKPAKPASSTQ